MSIANLKGKENVFSKRLKTLMSDNKVTQEELAEILSVRRQTISLYVNGSSLPPLEKFLEIANHFDVPTDYLLGRDINSSTEDYKSKLFGAIFKKQKQDIESLIEALKNIVKTQDDTLNLLNIE